jgi:hypothetical protein
MFTKSRTALVALGFMAAMAGSFTPAMAAEPGQVCYFGECRVATAPTARAPSAQPEVRVVAAHGSWKAVKVGSSVAIIDEFGNGAKLIVLIGSSGKLGLMLSHPDWRLKQGQQAEMTIRIDGSSFKGTVVANENGMLEANDLNSAFLKRLHSGRSGMIEVGGYSFEMTNLADAAAAMDGYLRYLKTASR